MTGVGAKAAGPKAEAEEAAATQVAGPGKMDATTSATSGEAPAPDRACLCDKGSATKVEGIPKPNVGRKRPKPQRPKAPVGKRQRGRR